MRKQQQQQRQQREAKHCGRSGDEEKKDETREDRIEEMRRKVFSWRGHYLYPWAGRKVERGKGKKKKNVNFIIFWQSFFFFASQFDPVFFFYLAKFLYFSTKKLRFYFA